MIGTEEGFNVILTSLVSISKKYDAGEYRYINYADAIDNVFKINGWGKSAFYTEMKARDGHRKNHSKSEKDKARKKSKAKNG